MAEIERLIPSNLEQLTNFRRDLRAFLELTPDELGILALVGDSAEGYSRTRKATEFSEKASISVETASRVLDVVSFLYERCREQNIPPGIAVGELIELARQLEISDAVQKADVLTTVLESKETFEHQGYAERIHGAVVPHFEDIEGVWDLRVVFNREGNQVSKELPTLILSVSWHDHVGQRRQVVFQLDEEEWNELRRTTDTLQKRLIALKRHMSAEHSG